jgi:glutamate synthase (NADPH) large chain
VLPTEEQRATHDARSFHKGGDGKPATDEALLKRLIEEHHRWTGSLRAREILDSWSESRARFVKVFPSEYRRALAEIKVAEAPEPAAVQASATIARARAEKKSGSKTIPAK